MKTLLLCILLQSNLLQQYLDVQHKRLGFSGVLLIAKKDSIVYQGSVGMASAELNVPIKIDNRFRIASITKSFTAWLIVQAAKRREAPFNGPAFFLYP